MGVVVAGSGFALGAGTTALGSATAGAAAAAVSTLCGAGSGRGCAAEAVVGSAARTLGAADVSTTFGSEWAWSRRPRTMPATTTRPAPTNSSVRDRGASKRVSATAGSSVRSVTSGDSIATTRSDGSDGQAFGSTSGGGVDTAEVSGPSTGTRPTGRGGAEKTGKGAGSVSAPTASLDAAARGGGGRVVAVGAGGTGVGESEPGGSVTGARIAGTAMDAVPETVRVPASPRSSSSRRKAMRSPKEPLTNSAIRTDDARWAPAIRRRSMAMLAADTYRLFGSGESARAATSTSGAAQGACAGASARGKRPLSTAVTIADAPVSTNSARSINASQSNAPTLYTSARESAASSSSSTSGAR